MVFINLIIKIYSRITRGRVLNGVLYAQRLQKLIYLHLFAECFMKISFFLDFVSTIGEKSS